MLKPFVRGFLNSELYSTKWVFFSMLVARNRWYRKERKERWMRLATQASSRRFPEDEKESSARA